MAWVLSLFLLNKNRIVELNAHSEGYRKGFHFMNNDYFNDIIAYKVFGYKLYRM